MENSPAALESKIALAKAADKHALANNHNMLQETMANWSKTLLEHKTLGAAAIMIGGLAIHDGKTTAAAVKTLGGEILPTELTHITKREAAGKVQAKLDKGIPLAA